MSTQRTWFALLLLAGCSAEEPPGPTGPTDTSGPHDTGGSPDTGESTSDTGPSTTSTGWSMRFGDENYDAAVAMVPGAGGDVIATGRFAGTITFGDDSLTSPAGSHAWLAALDSEGNPRWARNMGDNWVWDVVADNAGHVVVVGKAVTQVDWGPDVLPCCEQLVVGKFTPEGAHVFTRSWSDFLPISALRPHAVAVDQSDAIYVSGSFDRDFLVGGTSLVPEDEEDVWVLKLDSTGDVVWATALSGTGDERANDIALDNAGNVYVVGSFGGTVTAGAVTATAATDASLFVARIDASGTPVDVVGFDTTLDGEVAAAGDGDGILIAGGYEDGLDLGAGPLPFGGDTDAFVARFTDDLMLDWATAFGGSRDQRVADLGRDPSGAIWITGTAGGWIDFGLGELAADGIDMFLARLDPATHTATFARLYGDAEEQSGRGLAVDPVGGVVVLGDGAGSVDFGHGPRTSAGGWDVFVAKVDPEAKK